MNILNEPRALHAAFHGGHRRRSPSRHGGARPFRLGTGVATGLLSALLFAIPSCGGRGDIAEEAGEQHDQDAQEHTGEVHLDEHQLEAAGLETVEAAPGTIEDTLHMIARVSSNENTVVHVTPRVAGIVQAIHKGLGDRVKAGEPLADLWSVDLGNTVSAYLKAHASALAADTTLAKSRDLYRQRIETVTDVLDGEIAVARRIFEREKELQEKGIATIRPYLEADKELQTAILAKDRELTTLAAERDVRLLELEVDVRQARIEDVAARDRLLVLGFDEAEIDAFREAESGHGRMVLRAPRDGVVLERDITLNEHVGTENVLFVVHDLSTVWVLASAYEKDLARLQPGQTAYVRLDALRELALVGEISMIDFRVSAATRSTSVRIELANDPIEDWPVEFPLRPGMFGEVEVVIDSRTGRVVIPEEAIVHEGEGTFVFVAEEEEVGAFRRRPVTIRVGARNLVEIVEGVDPGETVVVKGSFTLKSMARKAELGEGHSH